MKARVLATTMLSVAAWLLLTPESQASVLYDEAGFIEGQQSFVQSFDITSAGKLTISLSNIPWLDTISGLDCFLTTSTGLLGASMSAGTESFNVDPGMIYAHWFGDAAGQYGIGVYGLKIQFQPNGIPVPLPGSLLLLLSGFGILLGWQRSKSPGEPTV
jgi:hypothetical protein